MSAADQRDLDRRAGRHALDMLADAHEAVRLAEGSDRTRSLGDRKGDERTVFAPPRQRDHDKLRAATFGRDAYRQDRLDALNVLSRQTSIGTDHGCNEFVEGEDRRTR